MRLPAAPATDSAQFICVPIKTSRQGNLYAAKTVALGLSDVNVTQWAQWFYFSNFVRRFSFMFCFVLFCFCFFLRGLNCSPESNQFWPDVKFLNLINWFDRSARPLRRESKHDDKKPPIIYVNELCSEKREWLKVRRSSSIQLQWAAKLPGKQAFEYQVVLNCPKSPAAAFLLLVSDTLNGRLNELSTHYEQCCQSPC